MSGAPKAAAPCTTQCTLQAAFLVSATFTGRTPLGRTESSASSSVKKRLLPIAAVPVAAAGLAAAFTVGNTSSAPVADEMTGHSATTAGPQSPATTSSGTPVVSLTHQAGGLPIVRMNSAMIAAIQPKGRHHRTQSAKYTVQPGDTLASIAQHIYASADYWPVLYWANHATVKYASQLQAGQVLAVPNKPAKIPSAPRELAPAGSAATTASSGQGYQSASAATATASSTSSGSAGSFQACVIARESGGNPQVMNASGHYGLYQFSASTWAAYGGNPADFGHASVAEQNQVFANAIAAGGQSNWAPYDGC